MHDVDWISCSVLAVVGLAACTEPNQRSHEHDAGTDDATCVVDVPELSLSAGGRLVSHVSDGWSVTAGPGLSLRIDDEMLTAYAGYDSAGETHLVFRKDGCADVVERVHVRKLEWTVVAEWDPAISGPPGREYGAWWLSDEDGGALYVFGGFHYFPRQFTPAADMWKLDFATGAWSEVAAEGAPLAPGSRATHGATEGTILLLGGARIADDGSLTAAFMRTPRRTGGRRSWSMDRSRGDASAFTTRTTSRPTASSSSAGRRAPTTST